VTTFFICVFVHFSAFISSRLFSPRPNPTTQIHLRRQTINTTAGESSTMFVA
jgi:hypothetical protein